MFFGRSACERRPVFCKTSPERGALMVNLARKREPLCALCALCVSYSAPSNFVQAYSLRKFPLAKIKITLSFLHKSMMFHNFVFRKNVAHHKYS